LKRLISNLFEEKKYKKENSNQKTKNFFKDFWRSPKCFNCQTHCAVAIATMTAKMPLQGTTFQKTILQELYAEYD